MAIAFAVFTVSELWQFGTKRKQSAINSNKVHIYQYPKSLFVSMLLPTHRVVITFGPSACRFMIWRRFLILPASFLISARLTKR